MSQHRFANLVATTTEAPVSRLKLPPCSSAFVLCPAQVLAVVQPWQRQVYELAYREAQAVVRRSILERFQMAINN